MEQPRHFRFEIESRLTGQPGALLMASRQLREAGERVSDFWVTELAPAPGKPDVYRVKFTRKATRDRVSA